VICTGHDTSSSTLLKAILLSTVMTVTSGFTVAAQTDAGLAELRDELRARRARLGEKLGAGSMAILWSAPARVYSRDVDYECRQDSDLSYLTGVDQPPGDR
jgi:Xaa-Pro aminopeptidase